MATANARHQKLPPSGPQREALREKGQFWTPDWVAEAMVAYVIGGGSRQVFDPAVGAGAFFRAAKRVAAEGRKRLRLLGTELDEDALQQAADNGLEAEDLSSVQITDFVLAPPQGPFTAIVANPPYIRHHRLGADYKARLKNFCVGLTGMALDGRAGLHVYFLLRALQLLDDNGRLAFIMPADTCEGVFAPALWKWITKKYRVEAVVAFAPDASPFPGVDTNPLIFMIRNARPVERFSWARCTKAGGEDLKRWVFSGFEEFSSDSLVVHERALQEALGTGLSRLPSEGLSSCPTLRDFASVLRGIATGANEFFFLTQAQAQNIGIPDELLIPAVGRTRDINGDEITPETIQGLEARGRPTLLFSPDGRPLDEFPSPVYDYLKEGDIMGLARRPLIASRRPWYKMEVRRTPPILFAYLGRRNARFIRNTAGVLPLTGFLCVYPHECDQEYVGKLWDVLRHPETIANLAVVGKSYGSGAIKVEPRALERLPLPQHVVAEVGLRMAAVANLLPFAEAPVASEKSHSHPGSGC
jgi:adenine-specific DNA-methyltransferase